MNYPSTCNCQFLRHIISVSHSLSFILLFIRILCYRPDSRLLSCGFCRQIVSL
jgi:hypothetical protein